MERIIDLHIHSHFSRATSKDCNLENLYRWGKIKGIEVIGTGDFTHPLWLAELREKLEPAEPGLFRLRHDLATREDALLPESVKQHEIRFILTVEIATIYRRGGKVRKLHNLIIAPGFDSVDDLNRQLGLIGNLEADGRPILGLDSKELLRMTLATDPRQLYIPAHIWTPWFGMFGSKSGFDSIVEAFEELAPQVRAIETGLSADPYMNWRVPELEAVAITSHSDAHSPPKLGREATIINSDLSYDAIVDAIRTNDDRLVGTIEFFPQEGKYHYDGHRSCGIRYSPKETKAHNGICPVCGKPLVLGVDYRVGELASHDDTYRPPHHKSVEYIIPLIELIAELNGTGPASKVVAARYNKVIAEFGPEFGILRTIPVTAVSEIFPDLAGSIDRLRRQEVHIEPGYDGVYGVISVSDPLLI